MDTTQDTFDVLNINKQLKYAIDDLGYKKPTPIQQKAFPVIMSGRDIVGVAQTGTGKTFAYMLPVLQKLNFSKQVPPRVLILVPTRELVVQVVDNIQEFSKYINIRVLGIYGEANINIQAQHVAQGTDIIVATPGRLYDLTVNRVLKLKDIHQLIIDEVDVMLDLGFRTQLVNLFDLLPERRQNIMFSATMTSEVNELMDDFFVSPERITIAVSGTPLDNIEQQCYYAQNFLTKANLLTYLLRDQQVFNKALVFISSKKLADKLFEQMEETFGSSIGIIHSNKSQNYRLRSVEEFESGQKRILIATDVISRGLDLSSISHVINFDVPEYPENYMHRIGRTGRAEEQGKSILFYSEKEEDKKRAVELLMNYDIPEIIFPEEVEITNQLISEERPKVAFSNHNRKTKLKKAGISEHDKKDKNQKVNLGGSYKRKLEAKHKKPKTRGDKNQNKKRK